MNETDTKMSIRYKFCTWQDDEEDIKTVRFAVFIKEQQVPIELEIDEQDEHCLHLVAFADNKPVGTARLLEDGHIGRMCVLKDYRLQGIATELLNKLVQKALHKGMKKVVLNAQLSAIPFYEKAGFTICSDTFLDAGIEHKTMQFEQPQAILGDNKLTIDIDNKALSQEIVVSLIEQAKNSIALLSQNLEPSLYNQTEVCQAIQALITKNRKAKIRIICKNTQQATHQGHCLINLAQNLSSFIELRKPNTKEIQQFQQSWLLIDDMAYCKIKNIERYIGTASFNQKLIVKESLDFFNHAWENSEVDQQTRRLSL